MKGQNEMTVGRYPKGVEGKGKVYFFLLKNIFCRFVCWLWVCRMRGLENIPSSGPFLIVSNHQTYIDFMFVTFAFRKVRFLSGFIKDAYFDVPCLNFFLEDLAQIRVDRDKKLDSIDKAVKILVGGHAVVLFPEGTRTKTGEIGQARRGLSLIGEKLIHVPVVPMGISGAMKIWPHRLPAPKLLAGRRVKISIGKPMKCADFEGNGKIFSEKVMEAIAKLAQ